MEKTNQLKNKSVYFANAELPDLFVGQIVNNRYQIIKQINSSRVYLCSDLEKSNKLFALKISPKEKIYSEEFNLRREYIIHSQFDSKFLVIPDEAIETEDKFGFLMEYIGGGDLSDLILSKGKLPVFTAIDIIKKVSSALEVIHQKGFVHADVKPENVLISSTREIKLTDFGLARDVRFLKNFDQETKGTLKYLCPRYLTTGELNFGSDLFSLGLIAFELLTGKVPFENDDIMVTLKERVYEDSPELSSVCPECPENFSKIVSRCLALSSVTRYQDASELVSDLNTVQVKIKRENKTTSKIKLFKNMSNKKRQGTILSFTEKSKLKIA